MLKIAKHLLFGGDNMKQWTEDFLEKFKDLEQLVKSIYQLEDNYQSAISFLENQVTFRHMKDQIRYCRDVRNLLFHYPKINDEFAVTPSEGMVRLLDNIYQKLTEIQTAYEVSVKLSGVYSKGMNDLVLPTMKEMIEKDYTNIPIMQDGSVIGVFSDSTIFSYLADVEIMEIDRGMTFSELKDYVLLKSDKSQPYQFAKKDLLLPEIDELFQDSYQSEKKIELIFLTQNGLQKEKLQGILTPWDMIGKNKY